MGKAKRAHLYPVMGTGACPLPILLDCDRAIVLHRQRSNDPDEN